MSAAQFINTNFMLENDTARRLFHEVAENLPIVDYHCHLPPQEIAENRQFTNLYDIWLAGDHYKWRALRANGIEEKFITGDASPREKFQAWATTLPMAWRNPLFHWSHLELSRTFEIHELLDESNADAIWQEASRQCATPELSVHGLLRKMRVEVVCTTDDPVDSLEYHRAVRSTPLQTKVRPTFRPDQATALHDAAAWNSWTDRLSTASGFAIRDCDDFVTALRQRHDAFSEMGCRATDHGLSYCPALESTSAERSEIFQKVRAGLNATAKEAEKFATFILQVIGRWNHEKGWVMQLHLGPLRNNSTRQRRTIGKDAGFDSMGDWPQAEKLSHFLDALDLTNQLPKTVLYNMNPADNYLLSTMAANFNQAPHPGKIQFGSGWWFLDQKEGMEWQMNTLSNTGLLSRFIGMTTDSRSFLSYPRHEYFRRILCNLLGKDVELGLIPNDPKKLDRLVTAICHDNARDYFEF